MTARHRPLVAAALVAAALTSLAALVPAPVTPVAAVAPVTAVAPAQEAASKPASSPELARLAAMVGLWETETVITGLPATRGLSEIQLMGGRWLIEDFKGELMGQEFLGHSITGWDPAKQRYVGVWVDTSETKLSLNSSVWDESRKAFVGDPEEVDLGQGPQSMRGVLAMPSPDAMTFTFTPDEPDALPAMTLTYTRKR